METETERRSGIIHRTVFNFIIKLRRAHMSQFTSVRSHRTHLPHSLYSFSLVRFLFASLLTCTKPKALLRSSHSSTKRTNETDAEIIYDIVWSLVTLLGSLLGSLLTMPMSVLGPFMDAYWHDFDHWEDRTYACDITPKSTATDA